MNTSLFEIFKIGIGPSSSHTVGPMRAANHFVTELLAQTPVPTVGRLTVDLYGSLALTGIGHGTDRAVLYGLMGEAPDTVDTHQIELRRNDVRRTGVLTAFGEHAIPFHEAADLRFHPDQMYPDPGRPTHPNGLRFTALDAAGDVLLTRVFYSVGGGFILTAEEFASTATAKTRDVPFPFANAADLLRMAESAGLSIADLVLANEVALLADPSIRYRLHRIRKVGNLPPSTNQPPEAAIHDAILILWSVMQASMDRGIATEGTLPGGLNVRRRAPGLARRLAAMDAAGKPRDPLAPLDAVTLAAIAVNEENAAGGRVVTAPTNGAAGVVPAIAHYYLHHTGPGLSPAERTAGLLRYFLTATAIGILYKENASISGAEVGCQGEVGVACSMAAAGLAAVMGGTPEQVENAAEIAMEHHLGLTCDPIGGLVQIPCIERNGMGALKAITAADLALAGDPRNARVTLDAVIRSMWATAQDMSTKYKETSEGGLAIQIPVSLSEC